MPLQQPLTTDLPSRGNRPPTCIRGHLREQPYTHSVNGRTYLGCRACATMRANLKYRNDDVWRAATKAKALARYYARQASA